MNDKINLERRSLFDSHKRAANGDIPRRNFRGFFPGVFTMANIVCGFIALISVSEGEILTSCWFIILAAFLDMLDGKVARLADAHSRFGVELDSLADFLSFGVAPAVMVFAVKLEAMGKWGWIISAVYIMAASYRLARYNVLASSDEKKNFLGLPVPGAALAIVTYVIFSFEIWGSLEYSQFLVTMMILFSALMVSQIEYDTVPDRLRRRSERVKGALALIVVLALIYNPQLTLFPVMAIYIASGALREMYRFFIAGVERVRNRNGSSRADGTDETDDSETDSEPEDEE